MDELAKGSNAIIAPPQVVKKLESQGLPFQRTAAPTLNERFEARRANASKVANMLPQLPPVELLPHSIKSLYEEILEVVSKIPCI